MKKPETPINKYEQALAMFMGGREGDEICEELKISRPLLYKWTRENKWVSLRVKMRNVADDLIIRHKVKSILHKDGRINDMIDKLLVKGMREMETLKAKDCFELAIALDKVRRLNVGSPTEIVDLNLNKFIEAENKLAGKVINAEYKVTDGTAEAEKIPNKFDDEFKE